jgi:sporulation protein YlmC with PRC-barrel domain
LRPKSSYGNINLLRKNGSIKFISISFIFRDGDTMQAEVSTLFGLNIYTEKGIYIGKVNDVVLEVNDKKATGIAATKLNPNMFDSGSKGVVVPFRWITAVGDVVLIRHVKDQFKKPEEIAEDYDITPEDEESQ